MTKICVISDTHGQHSQLKIPKCDLLVHCGDFTNLGRAEELISFNTWLGYIKDEIGCQVLVSPGNHDMSLQIDYNWAKNFLPEVDYLLVHEYVEIEGLKIFATPYTPTFYNWAFMMDEEDLVRKFSQIPYGLDVLICHGPPRGVLDRNETEHVGSWALRQVIEEKQPKYLFCGHIHCNHGAKMWQNTIIINAANADNNYRMLPSIILDI